MTFQPRFDFQGARGPTADDEPAADEALMLDLEGYEGPLHVLLELARRQKIDLLQISIARLAEQYLAFVQAAKRRRFTLAADYLVMASWLAYLKSRLLLPRPERPAAEEAPAEELAAALAFRLAKLEAMRNAVEALKRRPQLGVEVFPRGDPEQIQVHAESRLEGDLHALVRAYVEQRRRESGRRYAPERRVEAYPLEAARDRLKSLLPELADWAPLEAVTPRAEPDGPSRVSCMASTLAASLEMVKDGSLQVRQLAPFDDLFLRARQGRPA